MNLFELFESPVIAGATNLKSIANAATTGSDAIITLGGEPVTLEHPEARFVYGLYKKSLQNGRQEQFMQMLSDPRAFDQLMAGMRNMMYRDRGPEMAQATAQRIGQPGVQEAMPVAEATPVQNDTLAHVVKRFPKEVKDFVAGGELDDHLYEALFDYYMLHGEMPYGTAKGRSGDPFEWVTQRFDQDVHDYVTESITESKKKISERFDDDDDDWYGFNDKTRKAGTGGTVTKTSTGVVHKGKYGSEYQGDDGDEEDYDEWGNRKPGTSKKAKAAAAALTQPDAPKRGRGRPSQGVQATDSGFSINDHGVWYRKVKRSHPDVKMFGSRDKSIAIVQKGNKNYVAGTWSGTKGEIATKLSATVPTASLSDYKSARGRPRTRAESAMMPKGRSRPVREFIEQLRYVAEGYKSREEIRSVL